MALLCPFDPQFFHNDGTVAAGGLLYTYATGTTTEIDAWQNQAGSVVHQNPITLDSAGRVQPALWLTEGIEYRLRLETSAGVLIDEWDDIYGVFDGITSGISDALVETQRTATDAVAMTLHERIEGSMLSLFDFIPVAEWAAIQAGTSTYDAKDDINAWLAVGGLLWAPHGTYITSGQLTITESGTRILAYGAKFKAKDSTNFEKVVWATGESNVHIHGLHVDVNQANRSSSLTTRSVGIYLESMTDSSMVDCVAENAIGAASVPGFGLSFAGTSLRCQIVKPVVKNCGVSGKVADGIFMSGTQVTCVDPTISGCLDTGVAIESSNQSGIIGGTINDCGAIAAITNATDTDVSGNYIVGLTGYDWDASVTGGIQIGNPLSTSTGDLLNTRVADVSLERVSGAGPALNVRKTGSAITKGLTLSSLRVKGGGAQGLLINAEDVNIEGGDFEGGATSSAAIQLIDGCARVQIKSPTIRGVFNFGIYSDGVSDVDIYCPTIVGDSSNSTHGVYFANTASRCRVVFPTITGITVARVGSDAGTTPMVVQFDPTTATHKLLLTKSDVQVLTTRQTGYTNAMTGTANRATSYATGTITLVQLAERVKAIQDDLTTHGLIGP